MNYTTDFYFFCGSIVYFCGLTFYFGKVELYKEQTNYKFFKTIKCTIQRGIKNNI